MLVCDKQNLVNWVMCQSEQKHVFSVFFCMTQTVKYFGDPRADIMWKYKTNSQHAVSMILGGLYVFPLSFDSSLEIVSFILIL